MTLNTELHQRIKPKIKELNSEIESRSGLALR